MGERAGGFETGNGGNGGVGSEIEHNLRAIKRTRAAVVQRDLMIFGPTKSVRRP